MIYLFTPTIFTEMVGVYLTLRRDKILKVKKGFTVIEVLLALIVIGLITVL